MPEKRCLIVFAREPQKNKVKTRLAKELSGKKIKRLYQAFIADTLNLARTAKCSQRVLAYVSEGYPRYLRKNSSGFLFYRQQGKTLGERMMNAFADFVDEESLCPMLIIGTDSPHLPVSLIEQAFRALKHNDMVLGPTQDGGFYLIGMRYPDGRVFKRVVWSSDSVFERTMDNAKKGNKKVKPLKLFFDIDTPDDLKNLRNYLLKTKGVALETRRILNIS